MLEKTPDNAGHANVLAQPGNSGPQAADSADNEGDRHARGRGGIEFFYERRVGQAVELGENSRRVSTLAVRHLSADELGEPISKVDRGGNKLSVDCLPRISREKVEEFRRVSAEV